MVTEVAVLLYTTIGGIIGAGLTHYVTHGGDRRATRALVVERLADVEKIFGELRWPLPEDEPPYGHSRIARSLGLLEAAGLIAGVPRGALMCYIGSCRIYEDAHSLSYGADLLARQTAMLITDNIDTIRERGNHADISANLQKVAGGVKAIKARIPDIDQPAFSLHDSALEELSLALWHPLVFQFRRRKLHSLQKSARGLAKSGNDFGRMLRQLGAMFEQASSASSSRKASGNANS